MTAQRTLRRKLQKASKRRRFARCSGCGGWAMSHSAVSNNIRMRTWPSFDGVANFPCVVKWCPECHRVDAKTWPGWKRCVRSAPVDLDGLVELYGPPPEPTPLPASPSPPPRPTPSPLVEAARPTEPPQPVFRTVGDGQLPGGLLD